MDLRQILEIGIIVGIGIVVFGVGVVVGHLIRYKEVYKNPKIINHTQGTDGAMDVTAVTYSKTYSNRRSFKERLDAAKDALRKEDGGE
jgi:hypothetical protein